MAFSFPSIHAPKRTQVVAIDLGMRTTKAVWLQRKGTSFELLQYLILPAPSQGGSSESLASHFKQALQHLGAKTKRVTLIAGIQDAILRHAELPLVPVADMRQMLKFGSKNHLQQDLPDHVFDCHILPPRLASAAEISKSNKGRVLVGAAKRPFIDQLQETAKAAGLVAEQITLNLIGTANAFETAQPDLFAKEIVALVDIGFENTTINILQQGELTLSRVVGLGGDRLTSGLAEAMNLGYDEAETLKHSMPEDIQSMIAALLMPLGQELRASINFFEKKEDKTVGQILFSGGSACSNFMIETLQSELMVPCKSWNPAASFSLALPPEKMGELEPVAPRLAVAIGGAISAF